MTLLTSAECREIAERKMVEAEGDPVHGKEFRATEATFCASMMSPATR